MKYENMFIPETKEEAQTLIKARLGEIREIDGLNRMDPKSWSEMVYAKFWLEVNKKLNC